MAGGELSVGGADPTQLLRGFFPDLRLRFVNVVDLMRLPDHTEHPHGLPDADFDALFTKDKPVIFAYHGYPWVRPRPRTERSWRGSGRGLAAVRRNPEAGQTTPYTGPLPSAETKGTDALSGFDRMGVPA